MRVSAHPKKGNNNNNNNELPAYTGPPPVFAEARGARASLDCLKHGPRSGRDACVMAERGARLTWMDISPAHRITNYRFL